MTMNALGIACLQLMANLAGWHVLPPPYMTVVVVTVPKPPVVQVVAKTWPDRDNALLFEISVLANSPFDMDSISAPME